MTDQEHGLLREISGHLTSIEDRQETIRKENREEHGNMFSKIDAITKGGCPMGIQHEKDITELKKRPMKFMDVSSAVISALCAIVAAGAAIAVVLGGLH